MLAQFEGKNVLLLQGPMGPFFALLAEDLRSVGARKVIKVNFNGGDRLFYRQPGAVDFRGEMEVFSDWLEALIDLHKLDTIFLFGDCRPVHVIAREVTRKKNLETFVFEEGYIRPDFITLEKEGVNGYSTLPRNPVFYLNHKIAEPASRSYGNGSVFWHAALWSALYYAAASMCRPWYPNYQHHRNSDSRKEAFLWLRSAWRKFRYRWSERDITQRLKTRKIPDYFLAPLQVYNDAQIKEHSRFISVASYIRHIMASFAKHAPSEVILLIKHHPLDRGYHDYTRFISRLAKKLRITTRCFYIHDQHLPFLLDHAKGVVVVNSTVGFSALQRAVPVKVCGDSYYDMQGLTFQGSLHDFWSVAQKHKPNMVLLRRFANYLKQHVLINGSFYKPLKSSPLKTGLHSAGARFDKAVVGTVQSKTHSA
jgi:capsular polysaccharide export protein